MALGKTVSCSGEPGVDVSYSSSVASLKIGNSIEPAPETVKNNRVHLSSENLFFVLHRTTEIVFRIHRQWPH